jgi:hypothetical protein
VQRLDKSGNGAIGSNAEQEKGWLLVVWLKRKSAVFQLRMNFKISPIRPGRESALKTGKQPFKARVQMKVANQKLKAES